MPIEYRENCLTAAAFNTLRKAVGWNEIEACQAEAGVQNSHCFSAEDGESTVGMARVISDGGYVRYIADVVVHPGYQRQGIGRALMERCTAHIKAGLQPGQGVTVLLLAAAGKEPFYESLGFITRPRPELNYGAGMSQWVEK